MLADLRPNPDAGLTCHQAAAALGVRPDQVCQWHTRGWLTPTGQRRHVRIVGHSGRGRLYRYGDVVDAEADTRANPRSHRQIQPDPRVPLVVCAYDDAQAHRHLTAARADGYDFDGHHSAVIVASSLATLTRAAAARPDDVLPWKVWALPAFHQRRDADAIVDWLRQRAAAAAASLQLVGR